MLINLRNALMAGKRLPYDAEVEYLESTGTQYIDTEMVWDRAMTVSATVAGLQSTTYPLQCFFGARNLNAANAGYSFGFSNSNKFVSDNRGSRATSSMNYTQGDVYTVVKNLSGCSITNAAGTTENLVNNAGTQTATYNLLLFALNNVGTVVVTKSRFYACKIYDANGVLVRDLIPVRKGTVGYLYDRVSGKLFGNAGTGDFVVGPDVVPVEYIESHGTEYIDTGVVPDTSTVWRFTCAATNSSTQFIGAIDSTANRFHFSLYDGGYVRGCMGHTQTNIGSPDLAFHTLYLNAANKTVGLDETSVPCAYTTSLPALSIWLFGRNSDRADYIKRSSVKISASQIWQNDAPVRSFRPVRVGTDATSWEGAMMDVLTRRIYRNAGTGAFTYGNDLKYPIPVA